MSDIDATLSSILEKYQSSFAAKHYNNENDDHDILMNVFGISPEIKRENRQYWGRELGMCWQLLVVEIAKATRKDFSPAERIGSDEPADLFIGKDAIDTKYRIGSGDSGTLKKFKKYGKYFREKGLRPVLLVLREDNLPAAITACRTGGWTLYIGQECLDYIKEVTGYDVKSFLEKHLSSFDIARMEQA